MCDSHMNAVIDLNRNIVECKGVTGGMFSDSGFDLNRNIVECKGEKKTLLRRHR